MPATHRNAAHGMEADFCVGILVIAVTGRVVSVISGIIVVGGLVGRTVIIAVVGTPVSSVNPPGWSVYLVPTLTLP